MKAAYTMLLGAFVSLCSCSDSYSNYEDYVAESGTATFAITAGNRFGLAVTSRAEEDSTATDTTETTVEACAPEGISDLRYVISDSEGRIINHHQARMSDDFSRLTLEGLKNGSYSIMFLASGLDGWNVDTHSPADISEPWLTNSRDNRPVGSLYYHKKVDFTIGMDHAPVNEQVELDLAVARVDVDLTMRNPTLWRHIKRVSITLNDAVPTSLNADGTYTGEHTLTDLDLTEPVRNISFIVFPSDKPLSGYVDVVSAVEGGSDFSTRFHFSGLTLEKGKISRVVLQYRHPEESSGRIYVTEEQLVRFKPDTMFMSDEPQSVFYNTAIRSFYVDKPLQIGISDQGDLSIRFFSPKGIRNVRVLGRLRTVSSEWFDLAYFEYIPPFLEGTFPMPLKNSECHFTTETGRRIRVPAMNSLSAADMDIKIETDDPFMQKIATITSHWFIRFSKYSADSASPGNWRHMTPILCRHGVALALNMAFMFASPEFSAELDTYDGILRDNSGNPIDLNALRNVIRNHGGLQLGRVVNVGGLGGGQTYGLADYCYTGVYHNTTAPTANPHNYARQAMFHEYGHCLGYNHSSNMTYGDKWTVLCATVFVQMGRDGKLPVPNSTDVTSLPYNR